MSVFSKIIMENPEEIIWETEDFYVIYDGFPVSPGHALIITKRLSCQDFTELNPQETNHLNAVIKDVMVIIASKFAPVDGFNIGMNCGKAAGQTVMQFHCHVIPRYIGDMEDPKGGVRGVIPGKQKY